MPCLSSTEQPVDHVLCLLEGRWELGCWSRALRTNARPAAGVCCAALLESAPEGLSGELPEVSQIDHTAQRRLHSMNTGSPHPLILSDFSGQISLLDRLGSSRYAWESLSIRD